MFLINKLTKNISLTCIQYSILFTPLTCRYITYLFNKQLLTMMPYSKIFGILLLVHLATPWCLKTTLNFTQDVTVLDYSPDGTHFAITSSTLNTVTIYNASNYFTLHTYTPSNGTVTTARFSQNGNSLGIGLTTGRINVIPGRAPFSSTLLFSQFTKAKVIIDIGFNYLNDKMLVCYSNDNTFDVVDYNGSGPLATRSKNVLNFQTGCKWSKNDDAVISDANSETHIYAIPAAGTPIPAQTTKIIGNSYFTQVAVKPTTLTPIKVIASGGQTGLNSATVFTDTGIVYNTTVISTVSPFLNPPSSAVLTTCYAGDGAYYAMGGDDNVIWIFDDATDAEYQSILSSNKSIHNCVFSPDGNTLLAGTPATDGLAFVYVLQKTCLVCGPGFFPNSTVCSSCTQAVPSCSLCSSDTLCTACFQGYYLFNTTLCNSCNGQIQGCSTCQSATNCIQCNHGYYLQGGLCYPCNGRFPGCLSCNNTNCLLCQLDFHQQAGNCTLCENSIPNCMRCSANNSCLQCSNGFYPATSGTTCSQCDPGCQICIFPGSNCSLCTSGFYLNGFACSACNSSCLQCISSTNCTNCQLGYYQSGLGCQLCSFPCTTCSGNGTNCLTCSLGYFVDTNGCTACGNNCSLCLSSINCTHCPLGFYLSATQTCLSCSEQFQGCTQCQLGICLQCNPTSYLANTTSCSACHNSMPGCQLCSSNIDCTICGVGYYHTATTGSGACSICPAQCSTCYSNTNCSSCGLGYWLSGSSCSPCLSPCASCNSSASDCLSCTIGSYFNSTHCLSCSTLPYCTNCLSSSECLACIDGFTLSNGSCSPCPSACSNCNAADCLSCYSGSYLSNNTCQTCSGNCSSCSSSNTCLSCNLGFYFDSTLLTDQCITCTALISSCLACNSSTCYICANGYFPDNSSCSSCALNVSSCTSCSSALVCTTCNDGYYLFSPTSCLSCTTLPGCLSCLNSTLCSLCTSGYYANSGSCMPCVSNCSSCSSATNCLSCSLSYYSTGSECPSCQDTLIGCQSCSNTSVCLSCGGGYLLSANSCQPCSNVLPACSLCSGAGVCQSCQQGYFLNTSNNCQLCSTSASLSGCLICNSSSECQYCSGGYFLSGTSCQLCSPSLTGCQQCLNASVCLDCSNGYYLNPGTNNCQLCQLSLTGCIFCSNNSTCLQCQGGYHLNGSSCQPCSNPACQICDTNNPSQCITCNSGYYLSNNSCPSCPQIGCLDCNSTHCQSCSSGYYLSSGSCVLCSSSMSGCSKCSSSSVCIQCQSLFYLNAGNCSVCSSSIVGCSFCLNSTVCLACDGGYYLNDSTCNPCSDIPGCLICNGTSLCLTCNSGYFQVNSTCQLCSNSIPNCYHCHNDSACHACQSGFQLTNTSQCQPLQVSSSSSTSASAISASLAFKTSYVNQNTLKHALSVTDKSAKFQHVFNQDWQSITKIQVQGKQGLIPLTIFYVELSSDQSTLFFFTNNPTTISTSQLPIADRGRMLINQNSRLLAGQSMNQLAMKSSINLPKSAINNVLPSVLISQDLSMSHDLDDSSFYVTYVKESYSLYFFIFGTIVIGLLFIYGLTRALCFSMYTRNSEFIGHCLALKTFSLVVYPSYAQYVNFCLGFMIVDLPWLNNLLPQSFANQYDISPTGYHFYFRNMNLASLHFFTCILIFILFVVGYCCLNDSNKVTKKEEENSSENSEENKKVMKNMKFQAYKEFLLNFFAFGLAFAGFSSLLGSFLNYAEALTLNGVFYILGIVVYGAILSQALSGLLLRKRLVRMRVVMKATLLAGAGLNPLYLSAVAIIVDGVLMIIEYKLRRNTLVCPQSWLLSNIFLLSALLCLFFIPDSFLTLTIVMILVILAFISQSYHFWHERSLGQVKQISLFLDEMNEEKDDALIAKERRHSSEANLTDKDEGKPESPNKTTVQSKIDLIFEESINGENLVQSTSIQNASPILYEPKRRNRKTRQTSKQVSGQAFVLSISHCQNDVVILEEQ